MQIREIWSLLHASATISYPTFVKRVKSRYNLDKEPYLCPTTGATKYAYYIGKRYLKTLLTNPYFSQK